MREKMVLADQVAKLANHDQVTKLANQVAERDKKLAKLTSEIEELYQQLDMIPSRSGSSEGMMRKGVTTEVGSAARFHMVYNRDDPFTQRTLRTVRPSACPRVVLPVGRRTRRSTTWCCSCPWPTAPPSTRSSGTKASMCVAAPIPVQTWAG